MDVCSQFDNNRHLPCALTSSGPERVSDLSLVQATRKFLTATARGTLGFKPMRDDVLTLGESLRMANYFQAMLGDVPQ